MEKLKLSMLNDDVEVSSEDTNITYTVAELKTEITEMGEEHHLTNNWYTIKKKKWKPSADTMIESYIESEYDDMYEDWDERANDCITDEVKSKIQAILDEAFKDDYATVYWTYEKPVEIDIFPPKVNA